MRITRSTIITGVAALVLLAAVPSAIRDTFANGRIYLFSWEFLADLPARFTGPGRMRCVLQPAVAIILGLRGAWPTPERGARRTCSAWPSTLCSAGSMCGRA